MPHNPVTGPQMKMIGIGQFNLTTNFLQVVCADPAFDSGLCADIHKNRGLDHAAVGAGKLPAPGTAFGLQDFKHIGTPIALCFIRV